MTNEEKLAEIRHDLFRLTAIRSEADDNDWCHADCVALDRAISRLESDLARLTAPRGKTIKVRWAVAKDGPGRVTTWRVNPHERPTSAFVFVEADVPDDEVPVVEGTVTE